jgi:hypothetical protein
MGKERDHLSRARGEHGSFLFLQKEVSRSRYDRASYQVRKAGTVHLCMDCPPISSVPRREDTG